MFLSLTIRLFLSSAKIPRVESRIIKILFWMLCRDAAYLLQRYEIENMECPLLSVIVRYCPLLSVIVRYRPLGKVWYADFFASQRAARWYFGAGRERNGEIKKRRRKIKIYFEEISRTRSKPGL